MDTVNGYQGLKKTGEVRQTSVVRAAFKAIGRAASRMVRMLSFEAPNIFKSKEWPYY